MGAWEPTTLQGDVAKLTTFAACSGSPRLTGKISKLSEFGVGAGTPLLSNLRADSSGSILLPIQKITLIEITKQFYVFTPNKKQKNS